MMCDIPVGERSHISTLHCTIVPTRLIGPPAYYPKDAGIKAGIGEPIYRQRVTGTEGMAALSYIPFLRWCLTL
jgi:hypothetical protein